MSLLCRLCCKKIQLSQCRQLSKNTFNPWKSPVRLFQKLLDRRPLLMNTLIGGFFMFAGDMTQQLYYNSVIKWKEVQYLYKQCFQCSPSTVKFLFKYNMWTTYKWFFDINKYFNLHTTVSLRLQLTRRSDLYLDQWG